MVYPKYESDHSSFTRWLDGRSMITALCNQS